MARAFELACQAATVLCVVTLFVLLGTVLYQGAGSLSWDLLTRLPSRLPGRAGIKAAIAGSLWLIGLTTVISVPIGVGAAIYLEEYARDGRLRRLIQLNIANLAGVPSIVYGILGLGLFVRALALQRSVLSGALTLSLVILPVVIMASQEALRAVPTSLRHASFALGATRWQTIWHQVLPVAAPGILTGVILAVSRALGEAAPLVAVGAVAYVSFVPAGPTDSYTALPIQIFDWSQRPQREFHDLAAAAIIVLLAVLLCMNGVAVFLRQRYGKHMRY
jgi:phosphate transport system permease protein